MSSSTQQQAPAEDEPQWEQELGTGRWYIPWREESGNYVKWYYEEWYAYQVSMGTIRPEAIPRSEAPPKFSTRNQKKKKVVANFVTRGSSSRSQGSHPKETYTNDNRGHGVEVFDDRKSYYESTGYDQQHIEGDGGYIREEESNVAESAPSDTYSASYGEPQVGSSTGGDDQLASAAEKLTITSSEVGARGQYSTSSSGTSQWQQPTNTSPSPITYQPLPTVAGAYGYGAQAQTSWQAYGYGNASVANPLQNFSEHRYVAGQGTPTDGDYEELDSTYRQRNKDYKKFFRTGRVFLTLWTDPYSDMTANNHNETFESHVTVVRFGQKVHSKVRRFVVAVYNPEDRFCKCLPVTTYDGKGTEKRGLNLKEHGQIYSSNKRPSHVRGITKSPLKVNLSKSAKHLSPSFVNYGKVYTVETNVKVKDVGELDSASRKLLRQYWNASMIIREDSELEDNAAGNELLGVGAGLGPAEYSTAYTAGHSATASSTYDQQPSTTPVAYSTSSVNSHSIIASHGTTEYSTENAGHTYSGIVYSTASSTAEQASSIPGEASHFSPTSPAQSESSQAQESYEERTEYYSLHEADKSSISNNHESPAASTSAIPSLPQVESILDHKISQDKKGKKATWYLVSWVGDYDDSWVTDQDISRDWIDYYHDVRRQRKEGKARATDAESSPKYDDEIGEDEEDPISSIHQAHAESTRRDSSGAGNSRPDGRRRTNKDKNKGKKRTWF